MKKMQEKNRIYNIQGKITNSPSNQARWMANTKFQTQEGSKKSTRFLNTKNHTPPKRKAKHTKRQTQSKTRTLPEVENPRFYQISLDKPQDKHRLLNQQASQSTYDLGTKAQE
jgi:hypothetical protein